MIKGVVINMIKLLHYGMLYLSTILLDKLLEWQKIKVEVKRLNMDDNDTQIKAAHEIDIAVAVERLGGNPNGIIYGATGVSRAAFRCNVDTLFRTITISLSRRPRLGAPGHRFPFA